ncbi:hypothetical protein QTP86_001361 [Hemibagrus guttatus]|nr:hypothetical protein QTP86_001361 [Hemibagrus guttatus]
MLRFSLGVTRLDRIRNEYIRGTAHVGRLGDKVREARLRWFGHVQRRDTPVQYEGVEYGTVVTSNQKKKEDEVQYGELVFNTPAQKKSKVSKVQEEITVSGSCGL